jgi:hypothetical protein
VSPPGATTSLASVHFLLVAQKLHNIITYAYNVYLIVKNLSSSYSQWSHFHQTSTMSFFLCYKDPPRSTEAIPLTKVNDEVAMIFLEQHIITRFGMPKSLVFDNETCFSSLKLTEFSLEKGITLKYATNYYP